MKNVFQCHIYRHSSACRFPNRILVTPAFLVSHYRIRSGFVMLFTIKRFPYCSSKKSQAICKQKVRFVTK